MYWDNDLAWGGVYWRKVSHILCVLPEEIYEFPVKFFAIDDLHIFSLCIVITTVYLC